MVEDCSCPEEAEDGQKHNEDGLYVYVHSLWLSH